MFQSCCLHGYIQTKGHFKSDIHVLSVLQLLEKQRVENRFASYEVHIDHFFYVKATISFANHLTLSTFRFKTFSPD